MTSASWNSGVCARISYLRPNARYWEPWF